MDATQRLVVLAASPNVENDSDRSISPSWHEKSCHDSTMTNSITPTTTLAEIINLTGMNRSFQESSTESNKGSSTKTPRVNRIKRPMNAFMVWSQQRRQQIAATGQKFHNSDISKMLGAEWRKMEDNEKTPFIERAKKLREDHFTTYPDYVYRPRRRKRVVKSSGSVDSISNDDASGTPPTVANNMYSNVLTHLLIQYIMRNGQPCNSTTPTMATLTDEIVS